MKKIKHFIKTKKIFSAVLIILTLIIIYWIYGKVTSTSGETSYVVSNVKIGTIVNTVSGTGQVSASSQLDIKSKASGDLVYLNNPANGKEIIKGTLIAQVDTRDISITLENARIAYAKLVKPADASTLLQSENSYNDAVQSNKKSYDDAFNTLTNSFIDFPLILTGLNDLFYSRTGYLDTENARSVGQAALDLVEKAGTSYDKAKSKYDLLVTQYKSLSQTSASSTIELFVSSTYLLAKDISEAIKNSQNAVEFVRAQKLDSAGTTAASNISTWTTTINSSLANLLSIKNTMVSSRQDVAQKSEALAKVKTGADELDIASQNLELRQAQNNYSDYFIRAPFDGVLARLSVKATDSVSNGTVIGTIISKQKVADITLNEVDAAKVHVGQKATLTFDAIDGLTIEGTVISIDLVGTVTQGVVDYSAQVGFDSQDDRVRSGMSVSASIVTDTKDNILVVPNGALKTQGNGHYVEMFSTPLVVVKGQIGTPSTATPIRKPVKIGVSNDVQTEIISGINEGDQIVVRTIAGTAVKTTAAAAPSLFGGGGTRTGTGSATGGANVRIPRN